MQVDKPLTPHKIRNINPTRRTPPKPYPNTNTRTEDRHRIMDMHQILHGNRISNHLPPQQIPIAHTQPIRQPTPQRIQPNQITQVTKQTKKVQINAPPPVPSKVFLPTERRVEQGAMVYCPVCQRNYPNTRIKQHVQRHLQPDPVIIHSGVLNNPIITQAVVIQQHIPNAQTLMIVEPVECVMNNDLFGGNTFYVIDNSQAIPPPVIPTYIPQEEIIEEYVEPMIIPETLLNHMNASGRQSNNVHSSQVLVNDPFAMTNSLGTPSYVSNPNSYPPSQGYISYPEQPPLQIIQQQHSIHSPHSSFRQTNTIPITTSYMQPHQSLQQQQQSYVNPTTLSLNQQGEFVEMTSVPTYPVPAYPVYYPMKKATKFNLFSCFDDIGHDSFHATSMINRNDVYARARQ